MTASALVATLLAGCSAERPAPAPTPTAETLAVGTEQGEHGARPPRMEAGRLRAEIPAGVPQAEKYRSEVFWNDPSGHEIRLHEGDRFSCEITVTPHLAGTASDRDQWQVLWQLHGPSTDGHWPPPPLNLHVRGDTWRIGGGAGRADGEESYAQPFTPFHDGVPAHWRIDVAVSADPSQARVDAWLDGTQVVTDWHPPSGTRYPDHDYLTLKSGLYVGTTDGGTTARTPRYTLQEPLRCTFSGPDGAPLTPTAPGTQEAARP